MLRNDGTSESMNSYPDDLPWLSAGAGAGSGRPRDLASEAAAEGYCRYQ